MSSLLSCLQDIVLFMRSTGSQRYDFLDFHLIVDHVQGDAFASPSRFRVQVPTKSAGFPAEVLNQTECGCVYTVLEQA